MFGPGWNRRPEPVLTEASYQPPCQFYLRRESHNEAEECRHREHLNNTQSIKAEQEGIGSADFTDQRDFFPVVSATTGYFLAALRAAQPGSGERSMLLPAEVERNRTDTSG
jgi:hypothetical protein